jgi:hypothetical protein
VRSVMAWTVGRMGACLRRNCFVCAGLFLMAATPNLRAQQSTAPPPDVTGAKPPAGVEVPFNPPRLQPPTDASGKPYKIGDVCTRRTDTRAGVIKRDACSRWYCGRSDQKDIIEIRPNWAMETNCLWRLEGNACKCRLAEYDPKGKQQ